MKIPQSLGFGSKGTPEGNQRCSTGPEPAGQTNTSFTSFPRVHFSELLPSDWFHWDWVGGSSPWRSSRCSDKKSRWKLIWSRKKSWIDLIWSGQIQSQRKIPPLHLVSLHPFSWRKLLHVQEVPQPPPHNLQFGPPSRPLPVPSDLRQLRVDSFRTWSGAFRRAASTSRWRLWVWSSPEQRKKFWSKHLLHLVLETLLEVF